MNRAIAWIGIYFIIPLLPFILGGFTKFCIAKEVLKKNISIYDLNVIYSNFDFLKLIFALALIGILLEQSIRNYEPPISTDSVDKNPVVYCRFIYVVCLILWGLLFATTEFNLIDKNMDYTPFMNVLKFISLILLLLSSLLILLAQSQYKFKIQ